MTSRVRALAACLPLGLATLLIAVVAAQSLSSLGRSSRALLSENYRSAFTAQRMREELNRLGIAINRAAVGQDDRLSGVEGSDAAAFASDLALEESANQALPTEEIVRALRREWNQYQREFRHCAATEKPAELQTCILHELEPRLSNLNLGVSRLLEQKPQVAIQEGEHLVHRFGARAGWLFFAAVAAVAFGLGSAFILARRALDPLDTLARTIEQFGRGDLAVRAHARGGAEARALSGAFNAMADRMETYRRNALGEMLHTQLAARAVLNSLPDPVFVFGLEGEILALNPAAENLLPGAAAVPTLQGMDPHLRGALDTLRWHVLQGKGPVNPTGLDAAVCAGESDEARLFLPHAEPVRNQDGAIVAATVLLQDVTQLNRFHELRNDLLLTTAHQFRTPLTSVRMAIHLCLDGAVGPLSEKQQKLLEVAREECEHLHETVNEMLELARLQSPSVELEREEIRAQDLLSRTLRAYRSNGALRSVVVGAEPVPEELSVWADPESVGLVFSNLLENALRHTPGGGRITLRALPETDCLRFEVEDTGPGIPRVCRDRIFEKFWRGPGSDTDSVGLGLSIARDMISLHGGEIGVESGAEGGSRFWFTLPRAHPLRRIDGKGPGLEQASNL